MKHIHHPMIGDTKHGRGEHNKLFREKFECHRLLLHAQTLTFVHPILDKELEIKASFDEIFITLFKKFKWEFEV
jgi:tRNA pseudouridine65 synthase